MFLAGDLAQPVHDRNRSPDRLLVVFGALERKAQSLGPAAGRDLDVVAFGVDVCVGFVEPWKSDDNCLCGQCSVETTDHSFVCDGGRYAVVRKALLECVWTRYRNLTCPYLATAMDAFAVGQFN